MALNHLNRLWMDAEPELVEAVARKLCGRHGAEIYGDTAVTQQFLDERWRCFECEARDAIAIVRDWPARGLSPPEAPTTSSAPHQADAGSITSPARAPAPR